MKIRKLFVTMIIAGLTLTGCGGTTYVKYDTEELDKIGEELVEVETDKADYNINVEGVDVGINFYDGYKPYVIAFRTKDNDIMYCEAYFHSLDKSTFWSMDDAKQEGLIYDYKYDMQNGILVFYVKESEKLQLMPITRHYELEFETIDTYNFLWCDAALAKIGLGGRYYMVDVYPSEEFEEDDRICAKKVYCESYLYNALGRDTSTYYLFVNKVLPMNYLESGAE